MIAPAIACHAAPAGPLMSFQACGKYVPTSQRNGAVITVTAAAAPVRTAFLMALQCLTIWMATAPNGPTMMLATSTQWSLIHPKTACMPFHSQSMASWTGLTCL
jgi:hypothetical protein